jgi:hypothetical protein
LPPTCSRAGFASSSRDRTMMFAIDDDPAVIAERVRETLVE